jgi:hypothetical protein
VPQERGFDFDEAKQIGDELGVDWNMFAVEQFRMGLAVELEHGARDAQTDLTHDDLHATGRIVWAHLKRIPDYYTRLLKMEREGLKHWGRELDLPRRSRNR